jgi:hypothetical protein
MLFGEGPLFCPDSTALSAYVYGDPPFGIRASQIEGTTEDGPCVAALNEFLIGPGFEPVLGTGAAHFASLRCSVRCLTDWLLSCEQRCSGGVCHRRSAPGASSRCPAKPGTGAD